MVKSWELKARRTKTRRRSSLGNLPRLARPGRADNLETRHPWKPHLSGNADKPRTGTGGRRHARASMGKHGQ
eukprot:10317767-Lingulodinium_polyedra.AAC.1